MGPLDNVPLTILSPRLFLDFSCLPSGLPAMLLLSSLSPIAGDRFTKLDSVFGSPPVSVAAVLQLVLAPPALPAFSEIFWSLGLVVTVVAVVAVVAFWSVGRRRCSLLRPLLFTLVLLPGTWVSLLIRSVCLLVSDTVNERNGEIERGNHKGI